MSSQTLDALARTAARRFQSFAEAATSVLDLLHAAAPGERIALAQMHPAEASCRVIDSRGDGGASRGIVLPLRAREYGADGVEPLDLFESDTLAQAGLAGCQVAALDASSGTILGFILATGEGEHLLVLTVAARLLSYEWETSSTRAELRRLGEIAGPLRADLDRVQNRLLEFDDADRRAEQVRLTLAEMRAESERQAELSAHAERELRTRLASAEDELETMSKRFDDLVDSVEGSRRGERR